MPRPLPIVAALAFNAGCAASTADTRPLTDAERQALIREQEAKSLKREGQAGGRAGCAGSSPSSRLNARRADYQGADSFDSRGCPEEPPPGPGLTSPANPR